MKPRFIQAIWSNALHSHSQPRFFVCKYSDGKYLADASLLLPSCISSNSIVYGELSNESCCIRSEYFSIVFSSVRVCVVSFSVEQIEFLFTFGGKYLPWQYSLAYFYSAQNFIFTANEQSLAVRLKIVNCSWFNLDARNRLVWYNELVSWWVSSSVLITSGFDAGNSQLATDAGHRNMSSDWLKAKNGGEKWVNRKSALYCQK